MNINDIKDIEYIIEGILFAIGDAVPISKLSTALKIDIDTLEAILKRMAGKYKDEKRGIQIIKLNNCYQMCTKPECYEYIKRIIGPKENNVLSKAALETLAIIAYNQPITKSTIDHIRGVRSDTALNKLIERELIEVTGRLDSPGKPILYGTTLEFLRCFGLKSLGELPTIDNLDKLA